MKLKQKLASGVKKGWTMMELIFVIVVMGLGIAAVVQIGTNAMQDSEIDSAVGKSTQAIVGGLPKYKFEYQGSEGWYKDLKGDTIKTFIRPLTYDTVAKNFYPDGYKDIRYTFGEDSTNSAGWVCMDASAKYAPTTATGADSGANTLLAAQQKFVSNIKKLSSTITITQSAAIIADSTPATDTKPATWSVTTLGQPTSAANKVVCAGYIK